MSIEQPKLISIPFAQYAGNTWRYNITNTNETEFPNKATYEVGFPPLTMASEEAGGINFFGQDMNGILHAITSHIQYNQAGNFYLFDQPFANDIGGYNIGSVVKGSDGKLYQSSVNNNKTNPVGGSGWAEFNKGNYLLLTGGTVTGTLNAKILQEDGKRVYSPNNKPSAVDVGALSITNGGTVTGDTNFTKKLQQNGSDVITKENINQYQSGLGIGQSWQDVTSSRSVGTTYTNTTGKPIQVNVLSPFTDGSFTNLSLIVDDVYVAQCGRTSRDNSPITASAIVPVNSTYTLKRVTGDASFLKWSELR